MTPVAPPPAIIRLRDVRKAYHEGAGARPVFEGVNLEIAPGNFVVVFGRSGSGKSTLLNLISGIDLADSGEIHVLGRELTKASEQSRTLLRRASLGFIFQFFNLIPTLTVGENLLFPLELQGRTGKPAKDRALDLLSRVGLAERWDSFPDRLSGGEQQRVAIARALAHDPDIVLADEPTGNLDDESAKVVIELLHELLRPAGKTLVLVTHNPAFAQIADRTLRVAHGLIHEEVPQR